MDRKERYRLTHPLSKIYGYATGLDYTRIVSWIDQTSGGYEPSRSHGGAAMPQRCWAKSDYMVWHRSRCTEHSRIAVSDRRHSRSLDADETITPYRPITFVLRGYRRPTNTNWLRSPSTGVFAYTWHVRSSPFRSVTAVYVDNTSEQTFNINQTKK